MTRIAILLSSYNGEKFISEQLESIFAQQEVMPYIFVRDDGSSDKTLSILENFRQKFPEQIKIIMGENIGWKKSFMELLDYAAENCNSFDYFAFADQDDIWLPEKLSEAIYRLKDFAKEPALYLSSLLAYYPDGRKELVVRDQIPTAKNCLARNYATGCTVVFNSRLLHLLTKERPDMSVPHDQWAYMVAVLCGKVVVDPGSHILYRQHEGNQIGNKKRLSDIWKRRIKNFKDPEAYRFRETAAKELLRIHGDIMDEKSRKAVKKVAFYRRSLLGRIKLLLDPGYTLGNPANDLFFKLRILIGNL